MILVDEPLSLKWSEVKLPTKFFLLVACNGERQFLTYTPGMRSFRQHKADRSAAHELAEEYTCGDINQALQNLGVWRRALINDANQYLETMDEITIVHGEVMPERLYGCWLLCTDYYIFVLKTQPMYAPGRILLPWLPNGKPSGWNTVGFGSQFYDLDGALRYTRAWKQKEEERWEVAIKQHGGCPNRRKGDSDLRCTDPNADARETCL